MPYKTRGKCVYKKTGKKVGCTKGDIKKYLAALHANANESIMTFKQYVSEVMAKDLHKGDHVKNINPDCKHVNSHGDVEDIEDLPEISDGKGGKNMPGKLIVYKDKNTGRKLKKTADQLEIQ